VVVEDNVGHVLNRAVSEMATTGTGTDVVCRGVQQQKTVHGALHQHARVLLDQLALPVVAGGEVEVMGAVSSWTTPLMTRVK
jgi:hypothetical protein